MADYPDLSQASTQGSTYPDLSQSADMPSGSQPENNEKQKLFDSLIGKGRTPFGDIRDFMYGGANTMAHLAKLVYSGAPEMPDIRQANPNPIAEGIGSYLPYALAGGGSLLGSTVAAGAYGASQYDKGKNGLIDSALGVKSSRAQNSIEDMLINALTHGAVNAMVLKEAAPSVNFKQNAMFMPGESEFTNTPFKAPSFLSQDQTTALSPQIASELHNNLGQGKSLEETGKELASSIQDAYKRVKSAHQARYENILNTPTKELSIFDDEPILVKDKLISDGKYSKNYNDYNFDDKNIKKMNDSFLENPSVGNAHKFQSELGSEIGYMKKQQSKGNLDSTGKNRLSDYVDMRKSLQDDMRNEFNRVSPDLKNDYDQVTQDWKNNVEPFHEDRDLKAIAQGKINNPVTSQVVSIFKNPEEGTNKVVSYLPEGAKDNIAYMGAGKMPYQNTPKDIMAGMKSIETKGLSSYLRPEHQQNYANLRNNLEMEKNAESNKLTNDNLINQLRAARDKVEQKRMESTRNSMSGMNRAQNESNALLESKQKEYQKAIEELQNKKNNNRLARINAIRSLAGGAIGMAAVNMLHVSPESAVGSYIGKRMLKKAKK